MEEAHGNEVKTLKDEINKSKVNLEKVSKVRRNRKQSFVVFSPIQLEINLNINSHILICAGDEAE